MEQTLTPTTATSCSDLDLPAIKMALATLLSIAEDLIVIDCEAIRHQREANDDGLQTRQAFGIVIKIKSGNPDDAKDLADIMGSTTFLEDLNNLLPGGGNDFSSASTPTVGGILTLTYI